MSGRLPALSKGVRLTAVAAVAILLFAGTVRGGDSDFPFGPFRMYASRHDPNGTATSLLVRAVLESGRVVDVTDAPGAPRRAELEGRLTTLRRNPAMLAQLAPLYTKHLPERARTLELVLEVYGLRGGRSKPPTFQVVCSTPVPL